LTVVEVVVPFDRPGPVVVEGAVLGARVVVVVATVVVVVVVGTTDTSTATDNVAVVPDWAVAVITTV
jgi:hypothetical protein